MPKRFLTGINTAFVQLNDTPSNANHAVSVQYIDDLLANYNLPIIGGTSSQALVKNSNTAYDYSWVDATLTDERVKTSTNDVFPDYLFNKLNFVNGITKTVGNPSAVEVINISADVYLTTLNAQTFPIYIKAIPSSFLSVATTTLTWGERAVSNNEWFQIQGAIDADSGYMMINSGFITGCMIHCADSNNNVKDINLYVNNSFVASLGATNGTNGESTIISNNIQIPFVIGDKLRIRGGGGGQIGDTVVTLYTQWGSYI